MMSPQPRPIANYLADFDAPPPVPSGAPAPTPRAAPTQAAHVPVAPAPPPHVPAPANGPLAAEGEAASAEAFEAGKAEGLKLAEARHALERRRHENEETRRMGERVAEAEARVGTLLAGRLDEGIARLECALSEEIAEVLAPFLHEGAERTALDELQMKVKAMCATASWTLHGPRRLVLGFVEGLDPEMRERATCHETDGIDLSVEIDGTRLTTRLGEFADALRIPAR